MGEPTVAPGIDDALRSALTAFAARPRVLVASDYDGCVSPIVSRPELAVPNPASIDALRACSQIPNTLVALVSGRARSDLAAMSGADDPIVLVGSHGAEFDTGFTTPVDDAERELLDRIITEFTAIAARFPGTSVETKPASTTLHVRNATDQDASAAMSLAESGPATWTDVHVTRGKAVIELAVIETSKGAALDRLRDSFDADAVLYLGDDVTDEKAFARLRDGDVGIKVGEGPSVARHRIATPDEVASVLALVASLRTPSS